MAKKTSKKKAKKVIKKASKKKPVRVAKKVAKKTGGLKQKARLRNLALSRIHQPTKTNKQCIISSHQKSVALRM
jgi:hypothetical protein